MLLAPRWLASWMVQSKHKKCSYLLFTCCPGCLRNGTVLGSYARPCCSKSQIQSHLCAGEGFCPAWSPVKQCKWSLCWSEKGISNPVWGLKSKENRALGSEFTWHHLKDVPGAKIEICSVGDAGRHTAGSANPWDVLDSSQVLRISLVSSCPVNIQL